MSARNFTDHLATTHFEADIDLPYSLAAHCAYHSEQDEIEPIAIVYPPGLIEQRKDGSYVLPFEKLPECDRKAILTQLEAQRVDQQRQAREALRE